MIVLDSSSLVEFLTDTPAGRRVSRRWTGEGEAHAPHLVTAETAHVIRRLTRQGTVGPDHGRRMLERLAMLPFRRHAHDVLLPRMWELRANLGAYDATYVALAEALDVPLLTLDARLAAAPGNRATVELVT